MEYNRSLNGRPLTPPDIFSGQEVQQLSHVSWPFSELHRELTDPIIQHQRSVHTLPNQLQLHVSAAHHYSHPTVTQGEFFINSLLISPLLWHDSLKKNVTALTIETIFKMFFSQLKKGLPIKSNNNNNNLSFRLSQVQLFEYVQLTFFLSVQAVGQPRWQPVP